MDEKNPISSKIRPKGNGGVAILWHKDLSDIVTPLPDGSERTIAIHIKTTATPVVLINTYMPANTSRSGTPYEAILDEVYTISNKYRSNNLIIWTGDMNASTRLRKTNRNDILFQNFCKENIFTVHTPNPDVDTYYHFNEEISSQIDYFITLQNQGTTISKVYVNIRDDLNTSPHDSIVAHTNIKMAPHSDRKCQIKPGATRINWKKVDKLQYQEKTTRRLSSLLSNITPDTNLDTIVTETNKILLECSLECQPTYSKKKRRKGRFKWHPHLKELAAASKKAHFQWKQDGRPRSKSSLSYRAKQVAKSRLRQCQRQLAAKDRREKYEEIMSTHCTHDQSFYRLIQEQRESPFTSPGYIDFDEAISGANETDKWASYFEDLSSPKPSQLYNQDYKASMHLQRQVIRSLDEEEPLKEVQEEKIANIIGEMKNNKAPDIYGLTSEHFKFAGSPLLALLTYITQKTISDGYIPAELKLGLSTPVPKKDKSESDPDKYRRITVIPQIGKIVDRYLYHETVATLEEHQSKHQFGFTRKLSCNTAAMLITELMLDAHDTKRPVHLAFLDASKAFDVVDHDSALVHLYRQGVRGKIWKCFDQLYTDTESAVKWQGNLSRSFPEHQGIRQGAITSPNIFKARANSILRAVENHPSSLRIGYIDLGAIMVADDLLLATRTQEGMQDLIAIAESDASNEQYKFSEKKTKLMTINQSSTLNSNTVVLNKQEIAHSEEELHLGLMRTTSPNNMSTIARKITIARRTSYLLMGAGLHGTNGVGPEISRHIWTTFVTPRLTSGLEAIVMNSQEENALDDFFRANIRQIQALPKTTASPAIYLLIGMIPIVAQIHIKTICFFLNAISRRDSTEFDLLQLQLVMKSESSKSWPWYVNKILKKYNLPSAISFLNFPPGNLVGLKRKVKTIIISYWERHLKFEASQKSTLSYINLDTCSLQSPHPVWKLGPASSFMVTKATIKARLLVQRYPLHYSRTSGLKYGTLCPLCKDTEETMDHFLLRCPALQAARDPHLNRLLQQIVSEGLRIPEDLPLANVVLDPSLITMGNKESGASLEAITRDLCFSLHQGRSLKLTSKESHSISNVN